MIFPGIGAAQGQIRLLNYMHRMSCHLDEPATYTVVWPEKYKEDFFLDQQEGFDETLDYMLRFMPLRKFSIKHEYVDDDIYDEFNKRCTRIWHEIPEFSLNVFKGVNARGGLSAEIKNFHKRVPNKLVVFFDASKSWEDRHWRGIIDYLKGLYDVTEIEYRTPISEVMYHLQTAEFCFGHNGMWQLHANALRIPMICLVHSSYYWNHNYPDYFKAIYYTKGIFEGVDPYSRHSAVVVDYAPHEFLNRGFIAHLKERAESACNLVKSL